MTQLYHQLLAEDEKPKASKSLRWLFIGIAIGLLPAFISLFLWARTPAPSTELRYLYVSFHGDGSGTTPLPKYGVNQILSFDTWNPASAPKGVLDASDSPTPPRMLRDMEILKDGTLFVAQGLKFDSAILQYSGCNGLGMRQFQKEYRSPILVHPYAMTLLGDTLFASTQDSGTVVGFNLTEAHELSSGDRINFNLKGDFRYRPGITYRGIASYDQCLYLSVTEMDVVVVICDFDSVSHRIPVRHPIGLTVDKERRELYVASPSHGADHTADPSSAADGEVLVLDLRSLKVVRRLKHEGMKHPTNMVIHRDSVLVASQTQRSILEFNRSSGEFSRVFIQDLPDAPENIVLSPC